MISNTQKRSIRRSQQLVLVRQFQTRVEIILIKEVHGRLGHVSIKIENLATVIFMIASPNQTRSPISTFERFVVGDRSRGASHITRCERFRIAQETVTDLHRPIAVGSK